MRHNKSSREHKQSTFSGNDAATAGLLSRNHDSEGDLLAGDAMSPNGHSAAPTSSRRNARRSATYEDEVTDDDEPLLLLHSAMDTSGVELTSKSDGKALSVSLLS